MLVFLRVAPSIQMRTAENISMCAPLCLLCKPGPLITKMQVRSRLHMPLDKRARKEPWDSAHQLRTALACSTIENADIQEPVLRDFTLPSAALLADVTFGLMGEGKVQYVVISKVAPGSLCEEAGLRAGHKIKKISDPIRNSEMWELADNASLRFVRDAVRLRRADTIDLVILDDGKSYDFSSLTVGERLQKEWNQQQQAQSELTASQQRIKRRKEYMEQSGQGNSGSFFAVVFGLFVLPPLLILLVAYFTGYLDTLYQDVVR